MQINLGYPSTNIVAFTHFHLSKPSQSGLFNFASKMSDPGCPSDVRVLNYGKRHSVSQ